MSVPEDEDDDHVKVWMPKAVINRQPWPYRANLTAMEHIEMQVTHERLNEHVCNPFGGCSVCERFFAAAACLGWIRDPPRVDVA